MEGMNATTTVVKEDIICVIYRKSHSSLQVANNFECLSVAVSEMLVVGRDDIIAMANYLWMPVEQRVDMRKYKPIYIIVSR